MHSSARFWISTAAGLLFAAGAASAETILTFKQAMEIAFPSSGKVERFHPKVTDEQRKAVVRRVPIRARASLAGIYVGHSAGRIDAVAFVDHVVGRTDYITHLLVLSPEGRVRRMEIMVFREPLGDGVRHAAFRRQFIGKSAGDGLRLGREVTNVSGSTLSCIAVAERVRFLLAYHEIVIKDAVTRWVSRRTSPPRPRAKAPSGGAVRSAMVGASVFRADVRAGSRSPELSARLVNRAKALDRVLNIWRKDSELSRVVKSGGGVVSAELKRVLVRAREMHKLTRGRFDPTVGPLVLLWSQAARKGAPPDDAALERARRSVGFGRIELPESNGRVRIPGRVRVDLSGIGKGYILDRAGDLLTDEAPKAAALLSHGESAFKAVSAPRDGAPGWPVKIRDPRAPKKILQTVVLPPGYGLATSGTYRKAFVIAGVRYSHLIDPATGRPGPVDRAATVIAPSAADADALATALCLMPPREAVTLIEGLPGASALIWDGQRFHRTRRWPGGQ